MESVNKINSFIMEIQDEMIEFLRDTIKIASYTCMEEDMARVVKQKMLELDYDEVTEDKYGNIIGRVGNGEKIIYFDCHMDIVGVGDEKLWTHPPFSATVVDGNIYGRGACDMKSGLVASMYCAYMLKKLNLLEGKTIYIAATVMEEDYDGVATDEVLTNFLKLPDYAIMCEPTSLNIGIGHKGRALSKITVNGKSAHGSRPDIGINPTYLIAPILQEIEKKGLELLTKGSQASTMAVTTIESDTVSFNSIPKSASLYIDHRLSTDDTKEEFNNMMDKIVTPFGASWQICDFPTTTYTGVETMLHSYHLAWKVEKNNPLVESAKQGCEVFLGKSPELVNLGFSTNAVSTAGKFKIPTIVLGPGDVQYAHAVNEFCPISELIDACKIYTYMCHHII